MKVERKMYVLPAIIIALVMLFSGSAVAQTITVDRATANDLGSNQTRYCLKGTADGVGNNYHVDIQVKDANGGLICTFQAVVTNGAGSWSVCDICASGGTNWEACLEDDIGRQPCITGYFPTGAPTLSAYGIVILLALLIFSTIYVISRRRKGVTPA
jgi:hypothetical protein